MHKIKSMAKDNWKFSLRTFRILCYSGYGEPHHDHISSSDKSTFVIKNEVVLQERLRRRNPIIIVNGDSQTKK